MNRNAGTRERIMETTMKMAALYGLNGYSMKQVTKEVGVAESLLYKYFDSKENLLFQCYLRVRNSYERFCVPTGTGSPDTPAEVRERAKKCWLSFFSMLVENDYRTIYFFDYRDSRYFRLVESMEDHGGKEAGEWGPKWFRFILGRPPKADEEAGAELLFRYWMDVSGIYAKRVIRGELPGGAEIAEQLFGLLWEGTKSQLT